MTEPEKLDPPIVGKVTHCTIELSWDKDCEETDIEDGRRQYCIQEGEEGKPGGYGTVYNGFAKNHLFRGLDPNTTYSYRVRVGNNHGYSPWSATITVTTTKVPITGDDIHKAIINWEVDKVRMILDESDNSVVNVPDVYGMSPLMIASQKGYTSIVEILVERGASVNYTNASGKTSMMLTCFGGHPNVAMFLHEHGASLSHKDNGGSNALHWAVDGDRDECIRWLLQCGVDVDEEDESGWTALLRLATIDGKVEVAKTLIEHGAGVNRCDKTGGTALMAAALKGNVNLCKLLVENGANPATENQYGRTALDFAESFDKKDVVLYLREILNKDKKTETQNSK